MEISVSTVHRLTEDVTECVRDCFPIARSVVEAAINVGYIAAGGLKVAEEARQHSVRRSVLDLNRCLDIGIMSFRQRARSLDQPDSVPGLRQALRQIEEKRDSKPRNWTSLSAPKRIEAILDRFGVQIAGHLGNAYFFVYQDASEVVHGTVYGCFLSLGQTLVDQELALHDKVFTILLACSIALNRSVASIGLAHDFQEIVETADTFDMLLMDIPAFAEAFSRYTLER